MYWVEKFLRKKQMRIGPLVIVLYFSYRNSDHPTIGSNGSPEAAFPGRFFRTHLPDFLAAAEPAFICKSLRNKWKYNWVFLVWIRVHYELISNLCISEAESRGRQAST